MGRPEETETEKLQRQTTESNSLAAMHNGQLRIPGDVVNRATEHLPDNQRSAIRRLHAFYTDEALSLGELSTRTKIDAAVLSQVFRGKYTAKVDNTVAAIERFFKIEEMRSQVQKVPFIPTSLTRKIWNVCDLAVKFQRIGFIFSESQIGKSAALKSYTAEHNHGSTIYVSVPTGGTLLNFQAALAKALRISPHQRQAELRERIKAAFDDRMLLIVDEAHQCIPSRQSTSYRSLQTLEFVREIGDSRGCGMVLCATNVFPKAMKEDAGVGKILEQIKRRRFAMLNLPPEPTQADLNTFAAHYGLEPSEGESRLIEKQVINEEGLGMWLTYLRMANELAANGKTRLLWAHVLSAHANLEKLEHGKV